MPAKLEKNQENKIRKIFLQSYVLALIQNSYTPKEEAEIEVPSEKQKLVEETEPAFISIMTEEETAPIAQTQIITEKPKHPLAKQEIAKVSTIAPTLPTLPPLPQLPPLPKLTPLINLPQMPQPAPKTELPQLPPLPFSIMPTQVTEPLKLGKITSILLDPTIFSVECPGPNKNLIVNRTGQIQRAALKLTKREIDDIMNEISDKTRIPLTPGLFKVLVQDLIITAVISSYVGTRFIMQKRLPFQ